MKNQVISPLSHPLPRGSASAGRSKGGGFGAFTLVEVVLALGVCTFALTAILALMPVSLNLARHAQEISRVAKLFEKVTAELTQSQFATVAAMTTNTYFFDYEGKETDASGAKYTASSPDTYFTVTATIGGSPITNQYSESLLRVKLAAQTRGQTKAGSTTVTVVDMGY